MKFKVNYYWVLLLIPVAFVAWYLNTQQQNNPTYHLPYYGPKHAAKANDTVFHTVPDFEFTDQDGDKVTQNTFKNTVYVTEYFFCTCQSICPVMNNNLIKVYKAFGAKPDFKILSHTVDPETDSMAVLKDYALKHGVHDKKWLFVTGSKKDLYGLARKGYLLNAEEGDGGAEDFIHTQNFALVDKNRHIRGYYDGTDSLEIDRMIKEINVLFQEYAQ
ncbi:MAG: SCO family protein [Bacteroidia bacterium]|nr:SCO family protein [Bacteroidia bacterium]